MLVGRPDGRRVCEGFGPPFREREKGIAALAISTSAQRITIGLALIVAGALFLVDQLNGFPFNQSWPVILLVVGASNFLVKPRSWVVSGGIMVSGAILLLGTLNILEVSMGILWPLLLLGLGAVILFGGGRRRSRQSRQKNTDYAAGSPDLNVSAFFAGGEHRSSDQVIRSGQVSAIFGSAEVDLRGTTLEGDAASIEATALFGSLRLRVPNDWAVDVQTTNMFGSFESKRTQPADPKAKLSILATSTFGSIELGGLTDFLLHADAA